MVNPTNGGNFTDEFFAVAIRVAIQYLDSHMEITREQHTLVYRTVASLAQLFSEMPCDCDNVGVGIPCRTEHLLHSEKFLDCINCYHSFQVLLCKENQYNQGCQQIPAWCCVHKFDRLESRNCNMRI
ncbi:Os01g0116101 [Oryza sativa Japonica Group]|uniref:Os01g0116101 protein n=1 Tax=Oryza sativa subsp. japonica TaxID=39947 RepID=A0A0N7KC81_ORYSJ|nr:Os01g0116101 [Oryza sativa Japonica Group]